MQLVSQIMWDKRRFCHCTKEHYVVQSSISRYSSLIMNGFCPGLVCVLSHCFSTLRFMWFSSIMQFKCFRVGMMSLILIPVAKDMSCIDNLSKLDRSPSQSCQQITSDQYRRYPIRPNGDKGSSGPDTIPSRRDKWYENSISREPRPIL